MCKSIEQNNGRVELHVRWLQEWIFRIIRISYRDFRGNLDSLGGIVKSMNQRNTVTCTDFQGASPVQGNLHAGFLKEEEDGNILSLFNIDKKVEKVDIFYIFNFRM